MRTAAGSCVMTSVTHEQVDKLEQSLGFLTEDGWAIPEGLVVLRDSIDGTESEIVTLPERRKQ